MPLCGNMRAGVSLSTPFTPLPPRNTKTWLVLAYYVPMRTITTLPLHAHTANQFQCQRRSPCQSTGQTSSNHANFPGLPLEVAVVVTIPASLCSPSLPVVKVSKQQLLLPDSRITNQVIECNFRVQPSGTSTPIDGF